MTLVVSDWWLVSDAKMAMLMSSTSKPKSRSLIELANSSPFYNVNLLSLVGSFFSKSSKELYRFRFVNSYSFDAIHNHSRSVWIRILVPVGKLLTPIEKLLAIIQKGDEYHLLKALEYKVDINFETLLGRSILSGSTKAIDIIIESKKVKDYTQAFVVAFTACLETRNFKLATRFLQLGADINNKTGNSGVCLLDTAMLSGKMDAIRFLLDNGIDVNYFDLGRSAIGTSFHMKTEGDVKAMIKLLVQYGLKLDMVFGNRTPLLRVIREHPDYFDIIEFLIENGADVNQAVGGLTPLGYAISVGSAGLVRLFLKHNVNIHQPTFGRTPIQLAMENSHADIVTILIGKGAVIPNSFEYKYPKHKDVVRLFLERNIDVDAVLSIADLSKNAFRCRDVETLKLLDACGHLNLDIWESFKHHGSMSPEFFRDFIRLMLPKMKRGDADSLFSIAVAGDRSQRGVILRDILNSGKLNVILTGHHLLGKHSLCLVKEHNITLSSALTTKAWIKASQDTPNWDMIDGQERIAIMLKTRRQVKHSVD